MIISRTPFRISFFGGGTDYPAWYRQHGGAVVIGEASGVLHRLRKPDDQAADRDTHDHGGNQNLEKRESAA